MRLVLVLIFALSLAACSSSKDAASDGYRVSEDENGDVTILIGEGSSTETMIAALTEAAGRIEWTPPEAFAGLRQTEKKDLGAAGTGYQYNLQGGRFDVYVYQDPTDAEAQIRGTADALEQVRESGRIDSFKLKSKKTLTVPWEGGEQPLTRVTYVQSVRGEATDSYMYLLPDGAWWIKVRASVPEGRYAAEDMDEIILALLAEDDE